MQPIDISPEIIEWAIVRAGYNIPSLEKQFPNIEDWLKKEKNPTITQLRKFAQKVHLPFGYLFLETPPEEKFPIPYYRTVSSEETEISIELMDVVNSALNRQDWLSTYLADNSYEPLPFVGKLANPNNVKDVVENIRETLNLKEYWASKFNTWYQSLDFITRKVEELGIVILFNSVVGNNTHRPLAVEECRGFVLINKYAPFMFINSADSKSAQMFTIVHELAHIWIGESASFNLRNLQPADNPKEILCDRVAAEFLVPESLFIKRWKEESNIESISRYFKVSPIVIARRALDLKKIDKNQFFEFYNAYIKNDYVQKKKDSQKGGGDFYILQRRRLGSNFILHVTQAVGQNKLAYRDACRLTELRGDVLSNLIKGES